MWKQKQLSICNNMDGPRDYHTKWSRPDKDKDRMISLICGILKKFKKKRKDTNEPTYKTEIDPQT